MNTTIIILQFSYFFVFFYRRALNGSIKACTDKPGAPPRRLPPAALPRRRGDSSSGTKSKTNDDPNFYAEVKDEPQLKNGKLYAGIAVGIVFGVIILVLTCVGIFMCIKKRQ